jgi:hypothetical protein
MSRDTSRDTEVVNALIYIAGKCGNIKIDFAGAPQGDDDALCHVGAYRVYNEEFHKHLNYHSQSRGLANTVLDVAKKIEEDNGVR